LRQGEIITKYDPGPGVSIATLGYEYAPGFRVPEHAHGSDQLIYGIRGVMEVAAGRSLWLIPPHFGLWIPAGTRHRLHMRAVSMRTLYFKRGLVSRPPASCLVLQISPLLRELIVEAVRLRRLRTRNHIERALRDLLIVHLERASPLPMSVKLPGDGRALAAAQAVLRDPGRRQTLAALSAASGASVRTIQRAFRRELGIDFESWRRQVRLMKAVELLVAGCSIKEAAFGVGYRQGSAFVEAFRRSLGATPKAWISAIERLGSPG
jgi:AraC-like DNA-binding protein